MKMRGPFHGQFASFEFMDFQEYVWDQVEAEMMSFPMNYYDY